jgi:hypothetical protein
MDVIDLVRVWDCISRKKWEKSVTLNQKKVTKKVTQWSQLFEFCLKEQLDPNV